MGVLRGSSEEEDALERLLEEEAEVFRIGGFCCCPGERRGVEVGSMVVIWW